MKSVKTQLIELTKKFNHVSAVLRSKRGAAKDIVASIDHQTFLDESRRNLDKDGLFAGFLSPGWNNPRLFYDFMMKALNYKAICIKYA